MSFLKGDLGLLAGVLGSEAECFGSGTKCGQGSGLGFPV